jgi:hypothetical protein
MRLQRAGADAFICADLLGLFERTSNEFDPASNCRRRLAVVCLRLPLTSALAHR